MRVHNGFFVGSIMKTQNADLSILRYDFVVIRVHLNRVLPHRCRPGQTHQCQQKQESMHSLLLFCLAKWADLMGEHTSAVESKCQQLSEATMVSRDRQGPP